MTKRPRLGRKTLAVTAPAQRDLDDILDYLADTAGVEVALRFTDHLDAELSRLAWTGHSGVDREALSPGLRLTIVGNYSVYFRVSDTETRIIHVVRGSRDLRTLDFE
jgi:toxin ParE1/3/4